MCPDGLLSDLPGLPLRSVHPETEAAVGGARTQPGRGEHPPGAQPRQGDPGGTLCGYDQDARNILKCLAKMLTPLGVFLYVTATKFSGILKCRQDVEARCEVEPRVHL